MWPGKTYGQDVLLIDVPGYLDGKGRDQEYIDNILK